ncbi:hypothetical protein XA20_04490, partial [Lacticaseibacillus rhamnosus]
VLTQSKGILPKGATSFFDMSKWSLNNGLGEPNIGIVLFIAAIVIVLSFTKIKNKAVKDFALIGVILLLCSTKVFPWVILNHTPFKVIQY